MPLRYSQGVEINVKLLVEIAGSHRVLLHVSAVQPECRGKRKEKKNEIRNNVNPILIRGPNPLPLNQNHSRRVQVPLNLRQFES